MTDVRVAMWSGPRNISTAMMRAFENRPDTVVVDEPLYAAYLARTGIDHPMRDEVIARLHESAPWQRLYPRSSAVAQAAAAEAAGAEAQQSAAPHVLRLAARYPNPTHGRLRVQFETPERGPVRLGVYDLAGRMVRLAVDQVLDPGVHEAELELAGTAPGIYYCTMWTPAGSRRGTFVLMR